MAAGKSKPNQRNYYRVLYVQPDAPREIVQASYRTLMQKLKAHPDLGGDEWNAAVINQAFAVLSDTRRRRAYDAALFGKSDWKSLSKQTPDQRRGRSAEGAGFERFKPLKI